MNTHPSAAELLDAVIGFIETRAAPELSGRDAFLARVAVNALGVVKRELTEAAAAEARAAERLRALLGREGDLTALSTELAEALRSGRLEASPEVLEHLRLTAIDQVGIDQPNYSGLKAMAGR